MYELVDLHATPRRAATLHPTSESHRRYLPHRQVLRGLKENVTPVYGTERQFSGRASVRGAEARFPVSSYHAARFLRPHGGASTPLIFPETANDEIEAMWTQELKSVLSASLIPPHTRSSGGRPRSELHDPRLHSFRSVQGRVGVVGGACKAMWT